MNVYVSIASQRLTLKSSRGTSTSRTGRRTNLSLILSPVSGSASLCLDTTILKTTAVVPGLVKDLSHSNTCLGSWLQLESYNPLKYQSGPIKPPHGWHEHTGTTMFSERDLPTSEPESGINVHYSITDSKSRNFFP